VSQGGLAVKRSRVNAPVWHTKIQAAGRTRSTIY
jgi:hypothetical protein